MSKYQELKQERQKQIDLRAKKEEEFREFSKATDRILADLDTRIVQAKEELTKKIKRHFAGVEVEVQHSEFGLIVQIEGIEKLTLSYQQYQSKLKKEISDKIVEEYNEFYGEVKKESVFEGLRVATEDDIPKMPKTF